MTYNKNDKTSTDQYTTGYCKLEKIIIVIMYKKLIIGGKYVSIHRIESSINWRKLKRASRVRVKFKKFMRRLVRRGLLTDHGKSMEVISLTPEGVRMARRIVESEGEPSLPLKLYAALLNLFRYTIRQSI